MKSKNMGKHKLFIGMEVIVLGMIVSVVGISAAGSNPPSDGVKYNSTTVKAALDDLYEKVGSAGCNSWTTRNPDTSQIAVGGSRTYYSGIYPSNFTVSCANKTCPTCGNGTNSNITNYSTESGSGSINTHISVSNSFVYYIPKLFVYNQASEFNYTNPSGTTSDIRSSLTYSGTTITYKMPFKRLVRSGSAGYGTIIGGVGVLDTSKYTLEETGDTASVKTISKNLENCVVGYYSENFINSSTTPTKTGSVQMLTPVTKNSSSSFTINQLKLAYGSNDTSHMTLNYKVYCLKS